jgi:hypothetical protein
VKRRLPARKRSSASSAEIIDFFFLILLIFHCDANADDWLLLDDVAEANHAGYSGKSCRVTDKRILRVQHT